MSSTNERSEQISDSIPTTKTCIRCKKTLSFAQFSPSPTSEDGLTSQCRYCRERVNQNRRKQAIETSVQSPAAAWERLAAEVVDWWLQGKQFETIGRNLHTHAIKLLHEGKS